MDTRNFITESFLFVKQKSQPARFKCGEIIFPRLSNIFGSVAALYHIEDILIYKQPRVLVGLPIVRVKFSQGGGDFETGPNGIIDIAVRDDDIYPADVLVLKN